MLPMAEDALQEAIGEILGDDEEIAIHDYESVVAISEYENPYKLNELLHQLKPYDDKLIESLYFHFSSLEDVLKVLQSGEYSCYYDMESMHDVAYELVEEGLYGTIPDSIKSYIDYTKISRDLTLQGWIVVNEVATCIH